MGDRNGLAALKAHWYARLRDDGFVDAESEYHSHYSHTHRGLKRGRHDPARLARVFEIHSEFYRRAGHFLWDYEFPDETARHIWELFAEGKTFRLIAEQVGLSHVTVYRRVRALVEGDFKLYQAEVFSNVASLLEDIPACETIENDTEEEDTEFQSPTGDAGRPALYLCDLAPGPEAGGPCGDDDEHGLLCGREDEDRDDS